MKTQLLAINNIDSLINALNPNTKDVEGYSRAMNSLNINVNEVIKFCNWNKDFYTRNLIIKTEAYELMLLCWEIGQNSPVHNHQNQDCWMYVVQGNIDEIHFHETTTSANKLMFKEGKIFHHKKGATTFINDQIALHIIKNAGMTRAITIHLYSLPIEKCNIYNVDTGEVVEKKLGFFSVDGKLIGN